MTHKIEIEVPVTDEFIGDILVTAFDGAYGGCWYWAKSGRLDWPELKDGQWATVYIKFDTDCCPSPMQRTVYRQMVASGGVKVDQETVTVGIARILADEGYPQSFRDRIRIAVQNLDAGEIDANDADCIIQEGLFGKQIYG